MNTGAVVDKHRKRRFVLVCFVLTDGLLNTDWVIPNVFVTLRINLPLCTEPSGTWNEYLRVVGEEEAS